VIRPGAAATLRRWGEALAGGVALFTGTWLLIGSSGLSTLFGTALLLLGGFLLVTGIRRARFRTGAEGPGILRADEGCILYMGPVDGGMVALDDLAEVSLIRHPDGRAAWRLTSIEGAPLDIPEGAQGADRLLDALAPLPGLDGAAMVRAVQLREVGVRVVWRRHARLALT
jgi:hypothetical protein